MGERESLLWCRAVMCVKIPKTRDEILLLHSARVSALSGETKETEPKRRMKMIYNNHNITVLLLEILQLLEMMADRPGQMSTH